MKNLKIRNAMIYFIDKMSLKKTNFVAGILGVSLAFSNAGISLMNRNSVVDDHISFSISNELEEEQQVIQEEISQEKITTPIAETTYSNIEQEPINILDYVDFSNMYYVDGVYYFRSEMVQKLYDQNANSLVIDETKKIVSLTFDDAPTKTTIQLLDLLDEYGIKATFFVIGQNIDANKDAIIEAYIRGHEIGIHTYHHKDLTQMSMEEAKQEIEMTKEKLESIGIIPSNLVRPPYGMVNDLLLDYLDYPMITWSVDTRDWATKKPEKVSHAILDGVANNAVILLHDGRTSTIEGLRDVLATLQTEYQFVPVSTLYEMNQEELIPGKKYRRP